MKKISRESAIEAGLNRYFTGEVCKRGHIAERYVLRGDCCKCAKENSLKWRLADPERAKARVKGWISANPEQYKKARRAYAAKNAERSREKDRQEYKNDPDKIKKKNRAWYVANPEHTKQYRAAWRVANPEKVKVYKRTRKARKRGAEGKHTEHDLFYIFVSQDGLCLGCGSFLPDDCTVDHKTPLARGGSNWSDNLQLLCRSCNDRKGTKTDGEWRALAS